MAAFALHAETMAMMRWLARAVVLWWLMGGVAPVAAQAEAQELATPAGYEETFGRAFQDFERRRFVEAGALFRDAHRRFPNAHTLRAVGMVEYELGHFVESVDFLERALASRVRPLSLELRASAAQLLKQARANVTLVRVKFAPTQALLLVDGLAVGMASGDVLRLSAGEHDLVLEARGYTSVRRVVSVRGGEPLQELSLSLAPMSSEPAMVERPVWRNGWLWAAVGVVVAAGVTAGLVIGLGGPKTDAVQTGTTGVRIEVPNAGSAAR